MKYFALAVSLFLLGSCSGTISNESSSTQTPDSENMCTQQYEPVCGEVYECDDYGDCHMFLQTFSNECVAHNLEVSILYVGECDDGPISDEEIACNRFRETHPIAQKRERTMQDDFVKQYIFYSEKYNDCVLVTDYTEHRNPQIRGVSVVDAKTEETIHKVFQCDNDHEKCRDFLESLR